MTGAYRFGDVNAESRRTLQEGADAFVEEEDRSPVAPRGSE